MRILRVDVDAVIGDVLSCPMDFAEKLKIKNRIWQVFKPSAPIDRFELFAGRQSQINEITRAINQPGQHVVIFGERGVGKTSLSKIIVEYLPIAGVDVIAPDNINCDGTDNFSKIWHKVFREMIVHFRTRNVETPKILSVDDDDLYYETPDDIRHILTSFAEAVCHYLR